MALNETPVLPIASIDDDDGGELLDDDSIVMDEADVLGQHDIEEELGDLDFTLDSGLIDEATEAAEDLSRRFGDHPALAMRLARLQALKQSTETDDETNDAIESLAPQSTGELRPVSASQIDDLDIGDALAYYDLGVAFREMGQYRKAIENLEKAAASRERRAESLRLIALCELEQGNAAAAIRRLQDALRTPGLVLEAKVGVFYDLASAYEALGDKASARAQLRAIVDHGAPDFLDVRDRLARL